MKKAALLFFATFALYLSCTGPSLVPFRDAGEMATTVHMLGILHPPSYPLYTLAGACFDKLPLGTPAYRMNVFSGLVLSLAWGILFLTLAAVWGEWPACAAILMGACSYQFWIHALVSEMYTFNLLMIALVLWALVKERLLLAMALFGLGLANRPDLLLCAPAFGALYFSNAKAARPSASQIVWSLGVAGLGLGLYLYLPFRAWQHPVFSWNNPSTLDAFWGSLTRRGYGGTLDLLSQSYERGENFAAQMQLYGRHLLGDFSGIGPVLALLGLFELWQTRRPWFSAVLVGFGITGPLFIFLGNLPPNPHAVAIMESGYLMPDLFMLVALAAGLSLILRKPRGAIALGIVVLAAGAQAVIVWPQVNHRQNYVAVDFARNVRRTVPPQSVVIARSDVPIFGLFYERWVAGPRKDWIPLAQALAGSGWYQDQVRRQAPDLWLGPLRTAQDWSTFVRMNGGRPLYGTLDCEWQKNSGELFSRGLLLGWRPSESLPFLEALYVYRGRYRYEGYRDYFTPELIEEYAKAWFEAGRAEEVKKNMEAAKDAYRMALSIKPTLPYASLQLGYLEASQQHWIEADAWYRWAIVSYTLTREQSMAWKSLPEVRRSVDADYAQALVHRGVAQERLGHRDVAEQLYTQALGLNPQNADALYNRAVLYWGKEWSLVVRDLEAMTQAAPSDPRWQHYLPVAKQRLRISQ